MQEKLKSYPDGKFYCTRDGNHYKWYHSKGSVQTYIPKKNRELAVKLAEKKYLSLKLKELLQEKHALDFYLRHHSDETAEEWLTNHPEYQQLLSNLFQSHSDTWATSNFNSNPRHPEHLIHKTISGNIVRSKSEALIDIALYMNKIPFRYECALQLGETIVYPDFTIKHPITGKLYYWEHFGKMDNPKYAQNCIYKLHNYTSHGILPGIHLITTYESKEKPLTSEKIKNTITEYFS